VSVAVLANAFTYAAAAVVIGVTPSVGPAGGGEHVTVVGRDFPQSGALCHAQESQSGARVSIGASVVEGTVLSTSMLVCRTRPVRPGNYSVMVGFGKVQLSSEGARYLALRRVTPWSQGQLSVLPSIGPAGGGTLVTVSVPYALGAGDMMCRFGELRAETTALST